MSNGFQFYEGNATESAEHARITVRKGGVLVLTQATLDMLGADASHVQVGFNPETRQLALRSSGGDSKGAYRLRSQRNSPSRLVDGKRVFKLHGLAAESSTSYEAEDLGDGLIGFRLPETAADDEPQPKAKPTKRPTASK